MVRKHEFIIVGGGAAGMTAAIVAARAGVDTAVIEQNEIPGKKILATGNGKCNYTNMVQKGECYRGTNPAIAMQLLKKYDVSGILNFFESIGILPKERNGYVYPNSEQAASVREALEMEMQECNVTLYTNCHVDKIRKKDTSFFLKAQEKGVLSIPLEASGKKGKKHVKTLFSEPYEVEFQANYVLLSNGGCAGNIKGADGSGYEIAKSFGHTIVQPVPALVQLHAKEDVCADMAGVRQEAKAVLFVGENRYAETGEFLFTEQGISGIPVMQLSTYASRKLHTEQNSGEIKLCLDFFPDAIQNKLQQILEDRKERFLGRSAEKALVGFLPAKLITGILKQCGYAKNVPVKAVDVKRLAETMKCFCLTITGTNGFEQAQVTSGGVSTEEINPVTMESVFCPDLFFAGELADIDGTCGGYNLSWAWLSAFAAADAVIHKNNNRKEKKL